MRGCIRAWVHAWWVVPWSPFRHRWTFVFITCSQSEAMVQPREPSCGTPNFTPAAPTEAQPAPPPGASSLSSHCRVAMGGCHQGPCVWQVELWEGGGAPPLSQRLPNFKPWLSHFPAL